MSHRFLSFRPHVGQLPQQRYAHLALGAGHGLVPRGPADLVEQVLQVADAGGAVELAPHEAARPLDHLLRLVVVLPQPLDSLCKTGKGSRPE